MATETQTKKSYRIQGNPVYDVPLVGNIVYGENELGEVVLRKFNEKFQGVNNIEDRTKYKQGQPLSFTNIPRVLGYAHLMREETQGEIALLTPAQVIQYWNAIPERDSTYADTNAVAVFPNEGSNEDLRKKVLGLVGKQQTNVPLLVLGLDVERADNEYGFTFIGTDVLQAVEARWMEKNGFVQYDSSKKEIVSAEAGVKVYTPESQSGLQGAYRNGGDGLNVRNGWLLNSNVGGRVQVVQDPRGSAKNLEDCLLQLQHKRERQVVEINARYAQAEKLLRTGKL